MPKWFRRAESEPTAFRQNFVEYYVAAAILAVLLALAIPAIRNTRQPVPQGSPASHAGTP